PSAGDRALRHDIPQALEDRRRRLSPGSALVTPPNGFTTLSKVHVVLPGISDKRWLCGGLLIARRLADLLAQHIDTDVVTSADREEGLPFLDDVLRSALQEDLFLITWGPHVMELMTRLAGRRVVYYAQSTGWGSRLPIDVPIVCL